MRIGRARRRQDVYRGRTDLFALRPRGYFYFSGQIKNPPEAGYPQKANRGGRKFFDFAAEHIGAGNDFLFGQFVDLGCSPFDNIRKTDALLKQKFFVAGFHFAAKEICRRKRRPEAVGFPRKIFSRQRRIQPGIEADENELEAVAQIIGKG